MKLRIFATGWSEGFDGPGRRWVVYLKGCNLRCRWCASPESLSPEPQLLVADSAFAKAARRAGPESAARWPGCEWVGRDLALDELAAEAGRLRPLMTGITFGGGEPTLQIESLLAAAKRLQAAGIAVAVESNAATGAFSRLIGQVDLLIADLKGVTPEPLREWTGADGRLVKENLRRACAGQDQLWLRVPLISGFNTGSAELEALRNALGELAGLRSQLTVQVLRLHHLGEPKYRALGLEYAMAGAEPPAIELAERFAAELGAMGIEARVVN